MEIKYTSKAKKDLKKLYYTPYRDDIIYLLKLLARDPFATSPSFEKLVGFSNRYSRRINVQHRLVYEIRENEVIILSCWTHYHE